MTTTEEWREEVGQAWAELYNVTDRAFSGLTQQLLERLAGQTGESILDVGCGAGELSLALARARPQSRVVGVDVSDDLIETARRRGSARPNVSFVSSDASQWTPEPDFQPDLIVSRHGVMFFDDPVAAFAHLRTISLPDAGMTFSCFRLPGENPWASEAARTLDLPPPPDPHAPGPFAFADDNYVRSLLLKAGWRDVNCEPADFAFIVGVGEDPVADSLQFYRNVGPAARAMREMDGPDRDAAMRKLVNWLSSKHADDILAFPAAAWIVSARAGA